MWLNLKGKYRSFPDSDYISALQPKVYMLNQDAEGFYLEEKEDFSIPSKVYGDTSIINRWKTSYEHNSDKNFGIILSGIKGSGKTITAQMFCQLMNLPVILISQCYYGSDFINFLSSPNIGNAIIFIDEFEKIYGQRDESKDFVSIMDGNYNTKLIFLLTVNEFRINSYLINRLNRIKYRSHYESLESEIIDEVIDDLLVNKDHRQSVHDFFDCLGLCTFDLLINLIKEMNLFNENALEVGKHLNLEHSRNYYDVFEILSDNSKILISTEWLNFTADSKNCSLEIRRDPDHPLYEQEEDLVIDLETSNIEKINSKTYIVTTNKNTKFEFIKQQINHLVF